MSEPPVPRPPNGEPDTDPEVSAVDQVLASLQDLDDLAVTDHVAVFERAHEQLRRALDTRHG